MYLMAKLVPVLVLAPFILSPFLHISDANSLYDTRDSVIVLNAQNFGHYVYKQRGITLVNFYLNWCSHCINFSIYWKHLAKDIVNWKSLVRVAAIDCADNVANGQLCQTYGITRFPRIRLFEMNAQTSDLGDHFEVKNSVSELRRALIDWILKSHQRFAHNLNIFPVSIASKNELFNALPIHLEKHNLIFLERYPTHLGVEIVLDFSSLLEYVNIIRVHDRTGSLSKELFVHSVRLPSLIEIDRNQSFRLIASANSDDEELLRKEFGSKINHMLTVQSVIIDDSITTDKSDDTSSPLTPRKSLPLSTVDLYNTLRYSLHTEVTRYDVLNSTQILVLKKYFSVIYKYFPFDNENVRRFFKRMNIWFSNKTDKLKVEDLRAAMKISDGYLPPIVQWRHCSGSRPHFRGYSCGLWSLFHVLTVREYVKNTTHNSHEVLPLMRDFVINFFSCDYCAKHFEKTSRSLSSYLEGPDSSVLWLWRVHNQVNHRTKGSASEDPFFPKAQFPPHSMCGQCYKSNSEFDESNVLKYLLETYDQKNITKSADYFADQRILTKSSANILIAKKVILFLSLILSSSFKYFQNV